MSSRSRQKSRKPGKSKRSMPRHRSWESLYGQALELQREGRPDKAIELYMSVLEAEPEARAARHMLGIALLQVGRYEEAASHLALYLDSTPNDAEALVNHATALAALGELEEAAGQYLGAASIAPALVSAWRGAGNSLARIGKYERASQAYAKVLELVPDDLPVLNNRANVLSELGNHEQAIPLYQRIVNERPDNCLAFNNLGAALLELRRDREASEAFEQALSLDPDMPQAHLGLAKALQRRNELEAAEVHARKALELSPDENAWFRLGFILQCIGEVDEAGECYDKALECEPNSAVASNNLGVLALNEGRLDKAREWFQRALECDRESADAWSNMANILEKDGKLEEAEKAACTAVDYGGGLRALVRLAYILQKQGRSDESVNIYKRCLKVDPEDSLGIVLHLAALGVRETPKRSPDAHVRHLFDSYAGHFDDHLVNKLEYRGPQIIMGALAPWLHGRESGDLDVLDLGCGTGLCGVVLRPFSRRLDGVDLSGRMLAKAARREVYDLLRQEELVAYMDGCDQGYDLVVAGDVFVYVGDLSPVFASVKRLLRSGGGFSFTVERHEGVGFELGDASRYTHSSLYLEQLAAMHGFEVLSLEEVSTRCEALKPVDCLVAVLQRS